jgi:uncharacterized membrane protein YcaP (DUF421 family)
VLISDIAAHPLQDKEYRFLNGLVPIIILLSCEVLIFLAALKSVKFRSRLSSANQYNYNNGIINQKEMKKNRFSLDELCEELRKKDVTANQQGPLCRTGNGRQPQRDFIRKQAAAYTL